ncbi:hypothetical protein [Rhodopirellula islandica]|uniref:hypothetical protein n=1 Tax=Rhodopirellula islandica TaxID=595434 RepID=UPI000A4844D1|nr:hypothetical protein [Rhodopirellula islandica]
MLRTSMMFAATVLVGVAILFAARSAVSSDNAPAVLGETCPCGQCEAGCDCCLDGDVSCDNCSCEACECDACDTAGNATAAPKMSCCAGSSCGDAASDRVASNDSLTSAIAEACICGQCDADCNCCLDESVDCDNCSCESCQCEGCVDAPATGA